MGANKEKQQNKIKWWQLALIGVGCTIGTGFFLGSAIAIKRAGPMVLVLFILAAVATYIVYDALSSMSVSDPQKGSFRTYAKKAYGRWAGFSNGWAYWSSELLIMGSQLTALSIFAQYWFADIPLWILSSIFGVLGIGVIVLGVSGFEKIENIFGAMKIAAILMFIIIGILAISGFLKGGAPDRAFAFSSKGIFPGGFTGIWTAFIYVLYAFGGIEVMGIMSNELNDQKQAPKAGRVMLSVLTIIYVVSIGLAVWIVPSEKFNADESPFIMVINQFDLNIISHIFNGVLIIGGFSTMVASLYGITTILTTLAEDGDAPRLFVKTGPRDVPYYSVLLTTTGLIASIVVALLLPDKIYEYITTAASLMLLYIWVFILFTYHKISELSGWKQLKRWIGIGLLFTGIVGTLFDKIARIGFFISFGFILIITVVTFVMRKKWRSQTE
ncbi:transporter [Paraliobacillus quinghaiensis]|uniref:Transporter n=1 Tax=Paraliobacillus quinghaiensis TaxID=470815 RepID=A0A917TI30_9BACI|nr:amino acid permease [Paraliobacillus quinghaiensis]GGM24006.1 transporter [Paraliobacillus quinghaiensis]